MHCDRWSWAGLSPSKLTPKPLLCALCYNGGKWGLEEQVSFLPKGTRLPWGRIRIWIQSSFFFHCNTPVGLWPWRSRNFSSPELHHLNSGIWLRKVPEVQVTSNILIYNGTHSIFLMFKYLKNNIAAGYVRIWCKI